MARNYHRSEDIVGKLQRVGTLLAQGKTTAEAVRTVGLSEQTYHRRRSEYAGLELEQIKRLKLLEQESNKLRKAITEMKLEKLAFLQSDHLILAVIQKAEQTFANRDKAHRWLRRPTSALSKNAPLDLFDTDLGLRRVEVLLERITHGIAA
jgi:putative transposase